MSNPYPSRRELRLQRERAERAKLREAEIKRWTDENEKREKPLSEIPVAADTNNGTGEPEDAGTPVREATAQPVVESTDDAEPTTETLAERRRRRADSEITSTGMIPIISKPRQEQPAVKPRSRKEARELEARRAAQRRADIERLQREQGEAEEPKRRRATAPQTTPPPIPVTAEPEPQTPEVQQVQQPEDDLLDVEVTATHDLSATEITDMSGLDTIEIRRAELRAETERLTQEIIELGESNPNVIDPQLLRRQKELAEKSQELQDLETAAIEIVEAENRETATTVDEAASTGTSDEPDTTQPESPTSSPAGSEAVPAAEQQSTKTDSDHGRRRRRRTTQGPFVSGPFEVTEDQDAEPPARDTKKPPLAEFIRAPIEPEPERDPREPLEASSAHGLDTLDARDVEAPERRLRMSAIVMFAIGLVALIIAIILLVQ